MKRFNTLVVAAGVVLTLGAGRLLAGTDTHGFRPLPPGTERPGGSLSNPLDFARDLSGRSIKTRRVRAIHSLDDKVAGTTGWLVQHDPWLAYERGRDLALREFSAAEGAFGEAGKLGGKKLDDECTPMMSRDHTNSCAACHNTPWRDMGSGEIISKNGGAGRRTPHLFGVGQIEMIGAVIRQQLMAQADLNHDGWISKAEALRAGQARIQTSAGHFLDFGRFADNGKGRPGLNSIVYCWYVDDHGKRISWARSLNDPGVAGYNIEVQVFGFGQHDQIGRGGLSSSMRAVSANAWDIHSGLQAHDDTMNQEPNHDGLALMSLPGEQQFYTGMTRDIGAVTNGTGVSLEDPDRDGVPEEITEGDLDLLEFYLLNHPAPAEKPGLGFERGRQLCSHMGCFECHTPNWQVPHDRRFFDLQVHANADGDLVGRLNRFTHAHALTVKGVYSDFRQHDLGPAFHQMQFDGSTQAYFRTAPLWGVGSQNCFGHDGGSLDFDSVIRRHGGEAVATTARYRNLSPRDRDAVAAFLRGLVVYSTDTLPTDLDGKGAISQHYVVAGQDTGLEVFNPEWLFRHPVRIEGWVTAPDGRRILSKAATNAEQAYGCHLPALECAQGTGFPDILERQAAH